MIGNTISHYKIIEKIGQGGMGEVYLAGDLKLERQVALKFLPQHLTKDKDNVERFEREAKAAAALNHPNIITIYDVIETEDPATADRQICIVMEYVEGQSLRELINSNSRFPIPNYVNIISQIAEGLEKAHQANIIHRDIKPENILINTDGRVKILDFGLAKLRGSRNLTKDLSTLVTIKYISPEQARGEEISAQSDIWSVGILLYEMLTGEVPFKGDYEQAVIYGILNEIPQPPDELRADIPSELIQIINQSLQKEPHKRYLSISQITSVLKTIETDQKSTVGKKNLTKSFPLKYLYWGVFMVAIIVIAIVLSLTRKDVDLDQLMIQIDRSMIKSDYDAVYGHFVDSGVDIEEIIDTELFNQIAGYLSIDSNPQNANVFLSRINHSPDLHKGNEISLGSTPVVNQILIAGEYYLRLSISESKSISSILEIYPKDSLTIFRSITPAHFSEQGMIFIEAGKTFEGKSVPAFFIDIYEVTNREYFAFISEGGYRLSHLWPDKMVIKKILGSQKEALKLFVDQTGIPAPRHWSNGKYPAGTENLPVTGITWYEANAYALWSGKQLPDWQQWWRAAVDTGNRIFPWGNDVTTIPERANFGSVAASNVGSFLFGISPFGCFDMAGNVNEWLRDSNGIENLARTSGGSWQNPSYMFEPTHAQPFQRDYSSADIGFRCVKPVRKE